MKKLFFISLATMALVAASCSGSSDKSGKAQQQSQQEQHAQGKDGTNGDSLSKADVQNVPVMDKKDPIANPETDLANAPTVGNLPKQVEKPKVKPKPETQADKLLKQYNEALVTLIQATKAGRVDEEATKKIIELQGELDKLDKSGQLDATQKELFKTSNDYYNRLKK